VAGAIVLFLSVQLGALALVPTFFESGYQAVEDPEDPTNSLLYFGAILVVTGIMLAAFRYDLDRVVRGFIILVSGMLAWYVFAVFLTPTAALIPGAVVAVALLAHPEWYVIDAAGVIMGAGAAALFGITFGILPCLLLLTALAAYDAVSVYGTKHMLSLAEGVMDLHIPVVLVIPLSLSYSVLDEDFAGVAEPDPGAPPGGDAAADPGEVPSPAPDGGDDAAAERPGGSEKEAGGTAPTDQGPGADEPGADREAFFIGLGDAVMPTIMVASAAFFSPAPPIGVPVIALNLPALFAILGTIAGLLVLLSWVMRGRAHAGLPLLNGGAMGGYVLGSLVAGVSVVETFGVAGFL